MISARRAAALGLTVPLSAIMNAVLGLWPEPAEDDEIEISAFQAPADAKGGGSGESKADADRRAKEADRQYWAELDALRRKLNPAAVLAAVVFAELEYT